MHSHTDGTDLLPRDGFIFGEDSSGPLGASPIVQWRTRSGDLLVSASHHGYGYKSVNEDRVALAEVDGEHGPDIALFVVDGMGGRERGDLAAQLLSEELVRVVRPPDADVDAEISHLVKDQIETVLWQLPNRDFVRRILARWRSQWSNENDIDAPGRLIRSALESVNAESLQSGELASGQLRGIAEILRELAEMSSPDITEIALRRTQRRIVTQHPGPGMPDACFVGALIHTEEDGRRTLDVRQIGDCRLFVCSREGNIRFRTIGESVIAEPNLEDPKLPLTDLMAYSLHRNLVRNSINAPKLALKRYRKEDLPMVLERGDRVFLYSDGVDDLFSPEELIEMARNTTPENLVRDLLLHSERRMKYVSGLLRAQREQLPMDLKMKAYPQVHERLNRARVEEGCYVEAYRDGVTGRWTKPPKCDNTSICVMWVG
ncbi:MAG: protein phosphatase 2C domain-containing protein [Lentisphaeria bacterium]|nr:protein phosphatase 2C domain-containing protein [Lentisphaeria bacterium]